MALNNHKKGQPWLVQYPRLIEGGWKDGNDMRTQVHNAVCELHECEFDAKDGYDPAEFAERLMRADALVQECFGMLMDRYRLDLDAIKTAFIKGNADHFIDPVPFLEPEEE